LRKDTLKELKPLAFAVFCSIYVVCNLVKIMPGLPFPVIGFIDKFIAESDAHVLGKMGNIRM